MIALIRALPILGQLGVAVAMMAALGLGAGFIHHKIYQSGYDRALHDVAVRNQEAVDAVDKVRARVRDCNARDGMRWDQLAGECVRRD